MIPVIADPVELRRRGFQVLVEKLGWVNAVRYVRQLERGSGNYTSERDGILPDWDVQTLVNKALEVARRNQDGGSAR